jgi:tRNA nucleotidyltransferase (CCA-adding enzyme)
MNSIEKGKEILCHIENHGHQAYLVGGCVRDLLLHRQIHDVDICTSALPQEVCALFEKTIPTGLKHGTISVVWKDEHFEVTTFRTEGQYQDSRRPKHVYFVRTLKKDLERRDFTINALAMDKRGKTYDYFQGIEDIKQKRIRTVGSAQERFAEDALRLLRAIRFSAQLGFSMDEEVLEAIRSSASDLNLISMERKTSEFEKIMVADEANRGLTYFIKGDIAKLAYPFTLLKDAFFKINEFPFDTLQPLERWLLLVTSGDYTQEDVFQFLHALTLRKGFIKELKKRYKFQTRYNGRTKVTHFSPVELFDMGRDESKSLLKVNQVKTNGQVNVDELQSMDHIFDGFPMQDKKELRVSGRELMEVLKRPPGPWIESAIQILVHAVVTRKIENQKEKLIAFMLECEKDELS